MAKKKEEKEEAVVVLDYPEDDPNKSSQEKEPVITFDRSKEGFPQEARKSFRDWIITTADLYPRTRSLGRRSKRASITTKDLIRQRKEEEISKEQGGREDEAKE